MEGNSGKIASNDAKIASNFPTKGGNDAKIANIGAKIVGNFSAKGGNREEIANTGAKIASNSAIFGGNFFDISSQPNVENQVDSWCTNAFKGFEPSLCNLIIYTLSPSLPISQIIQIPFQFHFIKNQDFAHFTTFARTHDAHRFHLIHDTSGTVVAEF
jgi:hypothetical protein